MCTQMLRHPFNLKTLCFRVFHIVYTETSDVGTGHNFNKARCCAIVRTVERIIVQIQWKLHWGLGINDSLNLTRKRVYSKSQSYYGELSSLSPLHRWRHDGPSPTRNPLWKSCWDFFLQFLQTSSVIPPEDFASVLSLPWRWSRYEKKPTIN